MRFPKIPTWFSHNKFKEHGPQLTERALPGVSLVMLVNNPAHQVAAIAGLFRSYVDEIVIGVDHRVDPQTLEPIVHVADRCIRVKIDTNYANSSWLIKRANHEWVVVIDGDEVPSQSLLEFLPSLPSFDGRITHAFIQRRWVWPDINTYIANDPWRDDPQLRIIKRDSRILNWPTKIHESPIVDGPGVHLPQSIYHLDLVVNELEERRHKVELYERYSVEKHPLIGVSINRAYYLPEDLERSRKLNTSDDADTRNMQKVITEALQEHGSQSIEPVEIVTASELVTDVHRVGFPINEHECQLRIIEPPEIYRANQPTRVSVVVTNTGNWPYQPYQGNKGIAIGWHLLDENGTVVVRDAGRSSLTIVLKPGETIVLPCEIEIPIKLKNFRISFDLVEEGYAWFDKSVECLGSLFEID